MRQFQPRYPGIGKAAAALADPPLRALCAALGFHTSDSRYAAARGDELRTRLARGESVYLLGIGPGGHNAAAALVEVSQEQGIRLLYNNEEERFSGIKHDGSFPQNALLGIQAYLRDRERDLGDVVAVLASWDYVRFVTLTLRLAFEELPAGFRLFRRDAAPKMNATHVLGAMRAPRRIRDIFGGTRAVPIIGMRHHDNHAYFSYAVSPFAGEPGPTLVTVIDGYGDDGPLSIYLAQGREVRLLRHWPGIFDSLGLLYGVISSTQGGWTVLSSEGRYMGASAWGDGDRQTNPYYRRLREIIHCGPDGQVMVNRALINYHRHGAARPYRAGLVEILGEPIPPEKMWNPDAVLDVDQIEHHEITQERVDKAAALQLVYEDALFHIVDHCLRETGSDRIVMTGGTALNCIANMRMLAHFDQAYFEERLGVKGKRLRLWVPPVPGDAGVAAGAAYHFALRHGAPLGPRLQHAFFCGDAPATASIVRALREAGEIRYVELDDVSSTRGRERVAELVARVLSQDGVLGLFQGRAETGPRALGHRSILANPCNPDTLQVLNERVKYRERIRPLAPMVTMEDAHRLFHLDQGASADDYNAYNYMVLTVEAKRESHALIPAVIHKDGTSRIQIVRADTDPLCHSILKAMKRHVGVEVMVNTSMNIGSPIVQTPEQALGVLQRSRGMTGLVLVSESGDAFLAWHHVDAPPKDRGRRLTEWIELWQATA